MGCCYVCFNHGSISGNIDSTTSKGNSITRNTNTKSGIGGRDARSARRIISTAIVNINITYCIGYVIVQGDIMVDIHIRDGKIPKA